MLTNSQAAHDALWLILPWGWAAGYYLASCFAFYAAGNADRAEGGMWNMRMCIFIPLMMTLWPLILVSGIGRMLWEQATKQ